MIEPGRNTSPWSPRHTVALIGGVVLGIVVRLLLLSSEGLRDDTDQFAGWVAHIARNGLPNAFDAELTFGPVIAYVWGLLGDIEPRFASAVDASDPWLRALIKLPPTLADFGLAAGVGFALRAHPRWAVIGVVGTLLHPAVWYVSAWWGQYESMYTLAALIALLFAISSRQGLAAVMVVVAVLTKPQALPLVVPFAAWFFARGGVRGLVRAGAIGAAAGLVIWLPFLADGGPLAYLRGMATLQDETFSILSLRAWNLWWLVQEIGAGGQFASDRTAVLGPITFRMVGLGITGLLAVVVAHGVWRNPRPQTLAMGLAAITLVAFSFLTTMHERYAYAALVFLMVLIVDRRWRWVAVAFGVVFTLNLVAAIPATELIGQLPVSGVVGVLGALAMITLAGLTLLGFANVTSGRSTGWGPTGARRDHAVDLG